MKRIICVAVLLTYACPFISFYTLQQFNFYDNKRKLIQIFSVFKFVTLISKANDFVEEKKIYKQQDAAEWPIEIYIEWNRSKRECSAGAI